MMETLFKQMETTSWFSRVVTHVEKLKSLQLFFDTTCPSELIGQCQILAFEDACLFIEVNHASNATILQYRSREIIPKLAASPLFQGITRFRLSIAQPALNPAALTPSSSPQTPVPISKESTDILTGIAQTVSSPHLRQAILHFCTKPQQD